MKPSAPVTRTIRSEFIRLMGSCPVIRSSQGFCSTILDELLPNPPKYLSCGLDGTQKHSFEKIGTPNANKPERGRTHPQISSVIKVLRIYARLGLAIQKHPDKSQCSKKMKMKHSMRNDPEILLRNMVEKKCLKFGRFLISKLSSPARNY